MNAIHSTIESKSHGSTKQLILCKLLLVLIGACQGNLEMSPSPAK